MAEKYGKKIRELMVAELKEAFADNKGFVFSSIDKIKASEIDVLRKKLRKSGSAYLVVKNRIAKIALEEAGIDGFKEMLEGKKILGVGVIKTDPVNVAKLMMEFSKTNSGFQVTRGYVEGRVLEAARVKELSELPSRGQLISVLLGTMNAPITSFVGVLSSTLRSLLYALNAVKEVKEKQ